MSLKLSAQLDDAGDPNLPFKLYESYIQYNKWRLPDSALEVIYRSDWSGGSTSKSPYYSDLVPVEMTGVGSREAAVKLTLLKDMYVETPLSIIISNVGLFDIEIPTNPGISEQSLKWRYEQFLYFDAYQSHGVKDKLFMHQIEWTDGSIWSITARGIHAEWREGDKGKVESKG